jgi:uncharacterized protein (TIGR02466 family)
MTGRALFVTRLYEARLEDEPGFAEFRTELEEACLGIAQEDRAGQTWSKAHGYRGYTSYASLDDLPRRASVFGDLKRKLDRHAAVFADDLAFELGGPRLRLDSLWINVLRGGGAHSGHLHTHSVLSGTVYVSVPPGSGAIRFEDPRLPQMMAAPPRRADAPEPLQTFVSVKPQPGSLLMWESWLRHEVQPNTGRGERVSLSFNYAWR